MFLTLFASQINFSLDGVFRYAVPLSEYDAGVFQHKRCCLVDVNFEDHLSPK